VVIYPTQTVYGLGGRAVDAASALRIARIKGRPPGGLIVLASAPELHQPVARALAAAFWPGPLTLVVPAWEGLPQEILGPDGTIAVRIPQHPVAAALVAELGPITSTSANATGEPPSRDPSRCSLPVDAVLDVGLLPPSPPSSIVRGDDGRILREGAIARDALEAILAGVRR
jgi:L-threonylcarbamoyladenylate synthase